MAERTVDLSDGDVSMTLFPSDYVRIGDVTLVVVSVIGGGVTLTAAAAAPLTSAPARALLPGGVRP